jgi:two-component system sensor kinase FixL
VTDNVTNDPQQIIADLQGKLDESIAQQTATANALNAISRSAFHLEQALVTVCETAARLCDADQAAIYRREGDLYRFVGCFGFPPDYEKAWRAAGPFPNDPQSPLVGHRANTERRPVQVLDVTADPFYFSTTSGQSQARTALGVPLLREGKPVGNFVIARRRVQSFTDLQLELVETFAHQVVIAIENARLFEETSNDFAHRNEAHETIHRNEIRYRTIFETTVVSIWECDISDVRHRIVGLLKAGVVDLRKYLRDHPKFVREAIDLVRVVDVNDASLTMFGAREKRDLLRSIGQIWPVESEQTFAETLIAVYEDRPIFETEAIEQKIDGQRIDVIFTLARSREQEYRNTIFLSVIDITAFNRARVALAAAQSDLAHATRLTSLGELTASIAHEVNQPLAGIVISGETGLRWLRRETPDIEAAITSLERLVADAKRASSIIAGIRSLARNESPQIVRVDLNEVVNESLMLLGSEFRRYGVELSVSLETKTPFVRANRVQVQQIIINLAMNAVQAMSEPGSPSRRLRVSTAIEDAKAIVTVSDTGPGIDPSVRARLFAAFTTTKAEGMGLGLSVCASIVSRHGGQISASSNAEQGASFAFNLPIDEGL